MTAGRILITFPILCGAALIVGVLAVPAGALAANCPPGTVAVTLPLRPGDAVPGRAATEEFNREDFASGRATRLQAT